MYIFFEALRGPILLSYEDIFGTLTKQTNIIHTFLKIEEKRNHLNKFHILPGGKKWQDPCTFEVSLDCASDVVLNCNNLYL